MASITYDGQSFMIDGRRIWIVAGTIHYARMPREHWAGRIHAAKMAGLNTVSTPVYWARHEPRQGQFDFTGDNDIRHFVELIHEAGMWCILRPGPFVDSGWDLGGLPSWLLSVPNMKLRTANQAFLEASSRYITALAQQVRDLQVTSPGAGGPILLVQNEFGWTCGHDDLALAYLGELNRYFRESGLTVPTINANDLWQGVEGEIDCWTGFDNLLSNMRQLAAVRPDQPRVVIDFRVGQSDVWGQPASRPLTPGMVMRRLAEVLAGAGQYNLSPFYGGTNFGFSGGRLPETPESFLTTSYDSGAPLNEFGAPGPLYHAVKRVSTFASRFGRVLANLDPKRQVVVQHPGTGNGRGTPVVVHVPGTQGSVAFIFGDEVAGGKKEGGRVVTLLLPDGSPLPVEMGAQPVVWCLFDTRLTGRTTLDYCNLSAFAVLGRVLVCFGPAGSRGVLSINGSRLEVDVPGGDEPTVVEHEGVAVVVCSTEQIDATYVDDEAVYVGVAGIERLRQGGTQAVALPDGRAYTRISATGQVTTHKGVVVAGGAGAAGRSRRRRGAGAGAGEGAAVGRVALGEWEAAPATEHATGESARYASIPGPADLDSLGAPTGYGYYRIRFKSNAAKKHRVMLPQAAHRAHLILDGEHAGVVGLGPGAEPLATLHLKKKTHTLVVLAENLGRLSGGQNMGQRVGLYGHAWSVSPLRVKAPKVEQGEPLDVLAVDAPFWYVHRGETTDAARLTWTFTHRRKSPVFVRLCHLRGRGLVLVNGVPVHAFDSAGLPDIMLDSETLSRGNNTVQLALLGPPGITAAMAADLSRAAHFFEGEACLTDGEGVEWAFAKWEPPTEEAYGRSGEPVAGLPCWWRTRFTPDDSDAPLMLDLTGMTKGQIYINGRHLGRYFVATPDGKAVPPQSRYYVPRPMLHAGAPNELVLFEEHGASPEKCALVTG